MKFVAMATLGWTAAIAAVVASGEEARRYPIPQSVALERLATTPLPDPLLDMSGHTVSLVRESGGLSWYLGESDHRSVARVTLAPDGAATEVAISFDLAENALGYSPLSKTRLTRSMAESIFAEHVDAALTKRPFNARKMMAGTAREIENDPDILREYGEAVDGQFKDVATMLNTGDRVAVLSAGQLSAGSEPLAENTQPDN